MVTMHNVQIEPTPLAAVGSNVELGIWLWVNNVYTFLSGSHPSHSAINSLYF